MATRYVQPLPFFPAPSPSRYQGRHSHYTVDALRKFAQGAGSALLVFSGADAVANPPATAAGGFAGIDWSAVDFTSFEGMLGSFMNGPFTGPVQIVAAAMLFLMAGRCVARFFGLALGVTVLFLYTQGVTLEDAWTFAEHFIQRVAIAAQAFQTADVG